MKRRMEVEAVRGMDKTGRGREELEEHCSTSWRAIVVSLCAQGGMVSSLMEKE